MTLVTALVDLPQLEANADRRQIHRYFRFFTCLIEHQSLPMVVYCESHLQAELEQVIEPYKHRVKLVTFEFTQSQYYQQYHDRLTRELTVHLDHKNTVNYRILTWLKFELIQRTITDNPFNSNLFGWVDFGIYHLYQYTTNVNPVRTLTIDTPKLKVLAREALITVPTNYYQQGEPLVAGGFMTGSAAEWLWLIQWINTEIAANVAYGPLEEFMLAKCIIENPTKFSLYYGNYHQVLDNYSQINTWLPIIWTTFYNYNRADHSMLPEIADQIWSAYLRGVAELTIPNLHFFLDNYFVICIRRDKLKAFRVKQEYVKLCSIPEFKQLYVERKDRIDKNFTYL